MLKKISIFFNYWVLIVILFFGSSCNIKLGLEIPYGSHYAHNSSDDVVTSFNVTEIRQGTIYIFTSENKFKKVLFKDDQTVRLRRDEKKHLLGMPILYNITGTDVKDLTYYFGEKGTITDLAAAVVNVKYNQATPIPKVPIVNTETVNIKFKKSKVLTSEPTNSLNRNFYKNDNYLRIIGSALNSATISIDYNFDRGKVIICIINAETGSLEAYLDPKVQLGRSYVAINDVFVIPVIIPTIYSSELGVVKFEVGDPRTNGSVTVTEDGRIVQLRQN